MNVQLKHRIGITQFNKNQANNKAANTLNFEDSIFNNPIVKQQLLDYIYSILELSRYKYKLLEFEYDLQLLKEKPYYVSPNYNGIHSLLIFIKLKDQFYSCIIDRRTLNYNKSQLDLDKVKIIPVTVRLDDSIYLGTIIDGVLLYNNTNGNKNFVINDLYYFRGENMTDEKIANKMLNINTYLENNLKTDSNLTNINFIVNKIYQLKDIHQLVNLYIPKSKYSNSIKGLSFYPELSGTKLIYLYNNCAVDTMQEKQDQHNQRDQRDQHHQYNSVPTVNKIQKKIMPNVNNISNDNNNNNNSNNNNNNKVLELPNMNNLSNLIITFRMKKTDTIDVYNLYLGKKTIEDNKKILKYIKIGIAYIPTKECSFFCKNLFTDTDTVMVDCKWYPEKNKWIPIKCNNESKRPDLVDNPNIVNIINSTDS